jgi:hypothetical protein
MSYDAMQEVDVFEEIYVNDSKMAATDSRRFSFSVPAESYDPLYDDDGHGEDGGYTTEFYVGEDTLERLEVEAEAEERAMEIGVVKIDLADPISKLVSAGRNDNKFKIPSLKVKDARHIWVSANIGDIASYNEIETKLLKWAENNAEIRTEQKGHGLIITWKSASGCVCTAKWYSFVRWILCASLTDSAPK